MVNVTAKNFNQVITEESPVIIGFYSENCNRCPQVLKALKNTEQDVASTQLSFASCNAFENPTLANSLNIRSVPTVLLFQNNKSIPQPLPALPIHELLKSILKLVNQA